MLNMDDPGVRIVLADPPHQFETGDIRKLDIDHRDVGPLRHIGAVPGLGVGGLVDLHGIVRRKQRPATRQDHRVVVDDQNPRCRSGRILHHLIPFRNK
jgi:hypothetical protein